MNYTKTVWKDLPDTSTPISASNLNKIENGIEYLYQNTPEVKTTETSSNTNTYSCNYINNKIKDIFSTNEVKTNKINLDNKPIYRKIIVLDNYSIEDNTTYTHNIANIDEITDVIGVLKDTNGSKMRYPTVSHSGKILNIWATSTEIIWAGDDTWTAFEGRKHIITLEYTKTTDSSNS